MKERPILFSAPMVRALPAGTKTQTRRMVKMPRGYYMENDAPEWAEFGDRALAWPFPDNGDPDADFLACPYGQPGDRLWVREEHYRYGHWERVAGVLTKSGRMKWKFVADSEECLFEAPASFRRGRHSKDPETVAWHKRLARFMPKSLTRISLEIVNVRVERLNEISEADALAEGIYSFPSNQMTYFHWLKTAATETHFLQPEMAYRDLWNSINGQYAWDLNPWVWVVEFKRVEVAA